MHTAKCKWICIILLPFVVEYCSNILHVGAKKYKCEEYCGNCFPLTITVDGRQYVYRYGSAKQRTVGLGQLRYIYKGKHIAPIYACAMIAPIREEMERRSK